MNKVILMGRLTAEPESKQVSDKTVTNFTLAIDSGWGDNKHTNFITCAAWGKTGEAIISYVHKGNRLLVSGTLYQSRWEKDGKKNSRLTVTVGEFEFIERKTDE